MSFRPVSCPPKAEVEGSNPFGSAISFNDLGRVRHRFPVDWKQIGSNRGAPRARIRPARLDALRDRCRLDLKGPHDTFKSSAIAFFKNLFQGSQCLIRPTAPSFSTRNKEKALAEATGLLGGIERAFSVQFGARGSLR